MANILTQKTNTALLKVAVVGFMTCASLSGAALPTDYYASSSRLASGHWVKIRVSNEGMQQITYDQLQQWGFSNPKSVKIFGLGGSTLSDHKFSTSKPDDLKEVLSLHTSDKRLLFFGDAEVRTTLGGKAVTNTTSNSLSLYDANGNFCYTVNRNYYSTAGYYLITDAYSDSDVSGDVPDAVPFTASDATPLSEHLSVNLYEEENIRANEHSNVFFTKKYGKYDNVVVNFDIVDYATSSNNHGSLSLEVPVLYTKSSSTFNLDAITCASSNVTMTQGAAASASSCTDETYSYVTATSVAAFAPSADNTSIADGCYSFTAANSSSNTKSKIDFWALDRAVCIYPRENSLHNTKGGLLMNFATISAGTNFQVNGATSSTHVWNVSNPAKVFEHSGSISSNVFTGSISSSYSATDANTGACRLIAFNADDEQYAVEYVGEVDNQNIHGDETPDMMIVTTDELLPYAKQLAEIHAQHDGLKVNVYTQKQLFNEFGGGTPSAMAVRRAAKMFYDRDNSKFKNLLMYGKGTTDNRLILTKLSYEPLITFEVEPINTDLALAASYAAINFVSDDYYGYLEDGDTPANLLNSSATVDIAVGRIPGFSGSYASDVNKKIATYLQNPLPADAMMRSILVTDNGDNNSFLNQSQTISELLLSNKPMMTVVQAHNLIYQHTASDAPSLRAEVIKNLNNGVGLYYYNGHGAETAFAGENIWTNSYVNSTDYKYAPIAVLSTCSASCLDQATTGIADVMLQKNNGGAIAVIAAARKVLLSSNRYTAEEFARQYASLSGTSTIGELYRKSHNAAVARTSVSRDHVNVWCYGLVGDPAVPITMPSQSVNITNINGKATGSDIEIAPMTNVAVQANVVDASGKVDTSFNGTATVTIYEAPHTVNTIIVDSNDLNATVTLDETVLTSGIASVTNGAISTSLFVPYNTYESNSSKKLRVTVVATNTNGVTAAGLNKNAYISDPNADGTSEFKGASPEITEFYLNNKKCDLTQLVSNASTVYAKIKLGDAGLNTSYNLGGATYLYVDGVIVDGYTIPLTIGTDGYATLQYELTDLTDGDHVVTLSIADYAGNRVESTLNFTTGARVTLTVKDNDKSIHDEAELTFDHSFDGLPDFRLIIENELGETVFSKELVTSLFTWKLVDNNGKRVPDGFYKAYVLGKYGTATASSEKENIIVVK
jgi:hypothetical protein